jgi:hypothetical protein
LYWLLKTQAEAAFTVPPLPVTISELSIRFWAAWAAAVVVIVVVALEQATPPTAMAPTSTPAATNFQTLLISIVSLLYFITFIFIVLNCAIFLLSQIVNATYLICA